MSEKKGNKITTPLDGDPLYDLLYQMLWVKESMFDESNFSINIPDTVIFRSGNPCAWYFTDSEGVIRKKKQDKLDPVIISQSFIRKKTKYDVIAYFISIPEEGEYDNS
jgi:hypothetical protein